MQRIRRRPPPIHLQKLADRRSPRPNPARMPAAGVPHVGQLTNTLKTGVSVDHGAHARWVNLPGVSTIPSPRAPRFTVQRLEDRRSSETRKLGVSCDAPAWTQIDTSASSPRPRTAPCIAPLRPRAAPAVAASSTTCRSP